MKQAVKGALLSGLVFPGLGQLALKRHARGFAFLAVALASAISLVKTTVDAVMASLPTLDPGAVANLPRVPAGGSGAAFWVFVLCWLLSLIDAYLIGAEKDRQA